MSRERYYVGQYGYFWSFSKDEIIAFFEAAIQNDGYDLAATKEIKRPNGIYRDSDGGDYWSSLTGPSGRYYTPLDWKTADFEDALEELRTWQS